jgi:hypothetical protein
VLPARLPGERWRLIYFARCLQPEARFATALDVNALGESYGLKRTSYFSTSVYLWSSGLT